MSDSRDSTLLTPAEIEQLREDNWRAGDRARELIRAKIQRQKAAEKLEETSGQLPEAHEAKR